MRLINRLSKVIIVMAIFSCSILLYGQQDKNTLKRHEMPMAKEGSNGMSIGLYNINGNIEKTKVFHIEKGQQFSKIISMSNYFNNKRNYLLIALVDYKQIPFIVKEKEYLNYRFTMDANEVTDFPVHITNLKEGFHDVIFIIFKEPDLTMEENNLDIANSLIQVYPLRNNVIVGSGAPFEPNLSNAELVKVNTKNQSFDGLFISNSPNEMKVWYTQKTKNDPIPYYIHIGNLRQPRTYAVVSFLDWKVLDTDVLYLTLNKNEKKVYKGLLQIPTNINKNKLNFTSLIIPEPFSLLENEHGGANAGEIEQSLRTTIILEI